MQTWLLRAGMHYYRHRFWQPLARAAKHPGKVQIELLQRLLQRNRDTHFGREYGFSKIRNHAEFCARVPVQSYETLHSYIERQRLESVPALTAEMPLFYAQTSGTTGTPKYIPITASVLAQYRNEQALFSYLQYRTCPQAFTGKALGIMGAAVEDQLDSKHFVGSVSGQLYQSLPRIVQTRFVVPPAIADIADYNLKYLIILRLALAETNITYLGSPNPSTFLRLTEILNEQRELLLHSLKTGRLDLIDDLPAPLRQTIAQRLYPSPQRAAQLTGEAYLNFANTWPQIRLLTTWMGGSCGIALQHLRKQLPSNARIMELGYQATECRGSLALESETRSGLPPLQHHFFEFVEQHAWEADKAEFLTLDQLALNKRYYLAITTNSGLYRYFMNDLLEVGDYFQQTPLLRFVQKGKGVTNLTGEKLYETQVIEAIDASAREHRLATIFYILVADEQKSAYHLFIEAETEILPNANDFAAAIEKNLARLNIEYQAKRASGRLKPLTLSWLKRGAGHAYKTVCVQAGQREGQFKPMILQYHRNLLYSFEDYLSA